MATAKKAVEAAKKVVAAPKNVEKKVEAAAPIKAPRRKCAPKMGAAQPAGKESAPRK